MKSHQPVTPSGRKSVLPRTHETRRSVWDVVFVAVVAELILWLDLISKLFVRTRLALGESASFMGDSDRSWLITHFFNSGAIFGLFKSSGGVLVLISIGVVAIIIIYDLLFPHPSRLRRFALGLILGGALGNLVDRVILGYVTDIYSFASLPVFNLADIAIISGVIYFLVDVIRK